jgi:hypothetical protein
VGPFFKGNNDVRKREIFFIEQIIQKHCIYTSDVPPENLNTSGRIQAKEAKCPKRKASLLIISGETTIHPCYYDFTMRTGQLAFLTQ